MPKPSALRQRPSRSAPRPGKVRALPGTVYITRQVHFNSAHRLHNPTKGLAWNRRQYGPCHETHGHNYVLEVTVAGETDPVTGYVIDLGDLKRIMNTAVADLCDHRSLNDGVPFLRGVIPSTENLVIAFWARIAPRLKTGRLHCVRLYETPRNYAEFFGPAAPPAPSS
jgi:6-pyruvoyltetrahydropterin/6-carboxytetrahydropterin synthase